MSLCDSAVTAKVSFLKISSEPKHADATLEALRKVMEKQLYNDTMVRSQRGALTSAKLDSGETVDDLSERLQNLAVGLPELEDAAGDAVLLQLLQKRCQKSCRCTRRHQRRL
jgi:hypothetical protein